MLIIIYIEQFKPFIKSMKKVLSEVGFEPTPSDEDQNALSLSARKDYP
jgi:hypothetical protein